MVTLVCPACGWHTSARNAWRCRCGHALEFAEPAVPDGDGPGDVDPRDGVWAFEAFIPVSRRVTLGEGFTPLVDAPEWDASFKLEYVSPSGSFKDRGATVMLSLASVLGVERVVEDSSGNAGAAIAQYAARAGIAADVYVPADANPSKVAAIERVGATVVPIEGSRATVTAACLEAVEADNVWYASHAWNPAFYAGTATFAFEVAAQRDWSVPDAVVLPVGHGTLFLGAYRGFRALVDAGWTEDVPRLLGVQASGVSPLVDVDADAGSVNDVADGIQIEEPARRDQIEAALEETDGDVIAVDAGATKTALSRLHHGGFYVEPTAAAAPAGLERFRERGALEPGDDVVVPLTGSGLKD